MAYMVAERSHASIWTILYFVIGIFIAMSRGYMAFGTLSDILSMILAVLLWPLVLFGVDLHLALGA
jgi:hypothetical protein